MPRLPVLALSCLLLVACGASAPERAAPDAPATTAPSPSPALLTGRALLDALRGGGFVLYLRHTETTEGGVDAIASLGDCSRQRELSDAGRQDAREIGVALDRLGVPVGTVLASPFCRTTETATLAFGSTGTDEGLLAFASTGNTEQTERLMERGRALLAAQPAAGTNTVLVGHVTNLSPLTGVSPEEGGTAVFRPDGDGSFPLVGEVGPQGWQALARDEGVAAPTSSPR